MAIIDEIEKTERGISAARAAAPGLSSYQKPVTQPKPAISAQPTDQSVGTRIGAGIRRAFPVAKAAVNHPIRQAEAAINTSTMPMRRLGGVVRDAGAAVMGQPSVNQGKPLAQLQFPRLFTPNTPKVIINDGSANSPVNPHARRVYPMISDGSASSPLLPSQMRKNPVIVNNGSPGAPANPYVRPQSNGLPGGIMKTIDANGNAVYSDSAAGLSSALKAANSGGGIGRPGEESLAGGMAPSSLPAESALPNAPSRGNPFTRQFWGQPQQAATNAATPVSSAAPAPINPASDPSPGAAIDSSNVSANPAQTRIPAGPFSSAAATATQSQGIVSASQQISETPTFQRTFPQASVAAPNNMAGQYLARGRQGGIIENPANGTVADQITRAVGSPSLKGSPQSRALVAKAILDQAGYKNEERQSALRAGDQADLQSINNNAQANEAFAQRRFDASKFNVDAGLKSRELDDRQRQPYGQVLRTLDGSAGILRNDGTMTPISDASGKPFQLAPESGQITDQDRLKSLDDREKALASDQWMSEERRKTLVTEINDQRTALLSGRSETAPVPGARKAPDGKWYVRGDDGSYSVVNP